MIEPKPLFQKIDFEKARQHLLLKGQLVLSSYPNASVESIALHQTFC